MCSTIQSKVSPALFLRMRRGRTVCPSSLAGGMPRRARPNSGIQLGNSPHELPDQEPLASLPPPPRVKREKLAETRTGLATGTSRAPGRQDSGQQDKKSPVEVRGAGAHSDTSGSTPDRKSGLAATGTGEGAPGPGQDVETAVTMRLSTIMLDSRLQCRASINKATVAVYAERMKAEDYFPALDVYKIDGALLLVDGWQRYPAAQQAGLTEFQVVPTAAPAPLPAWVLQRVKLPGCLLQFLVVYMWQLSA